MLLYKKENCFKVQCTPFPTLSEELSIYNCGPKINKEKITNLAFELLNCIYYYINFARHPIPAVFPMTGVPFGLETNHQLFP